MTKRILITGVAAALLLSGMAVAQETGPYLWANYIKAKPGQGDQMAKMMAEQAKKLYDPLIESGKALNWGIAMPVIHDGDDPFTHIEWITFTDWSGADAFMKSFMEMQRAKSDEERAADMESWDAVVVPGSHADGVYYGVDAGGSGERPAYIMISYYQTQFGKAGDGTKMWKEYAKPVYQGLAESGEISGYGLMMPEIHRGEEWSHMSWYSAAGLAARDAVSKAFQEAEAARSEEENKGMMESYLETFVPEGHMDQILMVIGHSSDGKSEAGE
jgi:hypothetical protein